VTHKPNLFRTVLDALIAGRQRSAERYVAGYLRDHPATPRDNR